MVGTMKSQIFRTAAGLGSALFFLLSGAASATTVTVHACALHRRRPRGEPNHRCRARGNLRFELDLGTGLESDLD